MHEVHLSDQLYRQAMQRASETGFESVDDFVADIVQNEISEPSENYDHLFTPERIAHIDEVLAKVKAGEETYTPEQVKEHFKKRFEV